MVPTQIYGQPAGYLKITFHMQTAKWVLKIVKSCCHGSAYCSREEHNIS